MTSIKRFSKRALAMILLVATVATGIVGASALETSASVEKITDSLVRTSLDEIRNVLTSTSYADYLTMYGNKDFATNAIKLDLVNSIVISDTTATYNIAVSGDDLSVYNPNMTMPKHDGKEVDAILICSDDGKVTFKVNVEKSARYNIDIEYFTGNVNVYATEKIDGGETRYENSIPVRTDTIVAEGNDAAIERYVLIDGKVPYSEARSIELARIWNDLYVIDGKQVYSNSDEFKQMVRDHYVDFESNRPFAIDGNGNELKPDKVLVDTWTDTYLYDSTGYYSDPLCFYLEEGEHTITLQTVRETVAISAITLDKAPELDSYESYYESKGGDAKLYTGNEQIIVQAEYAITTSERTIYQLNNRSSIYSQPQDPAQIRLNEIGGEKWEYVGQWIEWEVEVPEEGFYSIIPRSMQSYYSGVYVSRKIYINGEVPFKEAGAIRFDYSSTWQTNPLTYSVPVEDSLGNITYEARVPYFYLNKGVNTIRMEAVLGDMAEILNTVNDSLQSINACYRKILMITGTSPDKYRDYRFQRLIPDVLKEFQRQSQILEGVSKDLSVMMGGKGSHAATLDRVANVCHRMGYEPKTIAGYMSTLKTYSSSLGTWLADTQNQPLDIDYICVQAPEKKAPRAEANFFEKIWGGIKKFFMSFFSDYDSLGSSGGDGSIGKEYAIEVWTVTSRDQAQIVRNLVDDSFSKDYHIPVTVKLVAGGTLLPATLAGTGPDVYMGAGQGDPVNYAIRSAVVSLNSDDGDTGYNFNDFSRWADDPVYKDLIADNLIPTFDEVTEWFAPSAMTPFTLYGKSYAIPQTMSFSMMFYRKDIFVDLGVQVPNTWDDFYNIIYQIQAAELDLGFPTGIGGSTIMMYQQGETYYDEGDYDYYLELFRSYYTEVGYNGYDTVDEYLAANNFTYVNEEGTILPKTDGISINLDSDISLAMFNKVCELFTMYDFPVQYDFANRFRSGEMPIAITDYSMYNSLIVFAPEINGLWEFTPLPGTAYEDPTTGETKIDNTTVGGVSAMIMMRSVTEKNALGAWAFMQWWMRDDIQTSFGNEMIALLGPSAKQATANMRALGGMSWSKDEYENLFAQFNAVQCTPEYPGSYIVGRYTNFAFLDVKNDDKIPVETMQSYISDINNELTRKRAEFGLPTLDTVKDMEDYLKEHNIAVPEHEEDSKKGGN